MKFLKFGIGRIKDIVMALNTVVRMAWGTVAAYMGVMDAVDMRAFQGGNVPDDPRTIQAFEHPLPGMRFSEMYNFWVYVLSISSKGAVSIRTFSGHPANPGIESIKYETYDSVKEFQKRFKYGTLDGYYVRYCDDLAFERLAQERPATTEELNATYWLTE
jgi:hypothetical protein